MDKYRFFSYKPNSAIIFPYKINMNFWDSVSILEEDYMHEDFGYNVDDSENVLAHASGVIHKLMNDDNNIELKDELLRDFENYLVCMESFQGTRSIAYQLFLALISFDLIRRAYLYIIHYYLQCRKNFLNGDGPSRALCLDFEIVYVAIGDRALVEEFDFDLAQKYYHLAQLSWPVEEPYYSDVYDDEIDPLSGFSSAMSLEWSKKADSLYQLSRGFSNVNLDSFDCYDKAELKDRFEICLLLAKNYDERAIEEIDSFIEFLGSRFEKVTDRERLGLVMLGALRKLCFPNMLFFLSNEREEVQDLYSDDIIQLIKDVSVGANTKLLDWLEEADKETAHRTVLEFYKANYYIDEIEKLLQSKSPNSLSAYYTSYDTFSLMLPDFCANDRDDECGKFSVMNIAYMNDPNEGLIIRKRLFGENNIPSVDSERQVLETPYVFLKCFTSLVDYLPMWQMYGDAAQGVCIVVDWDSSSDTSLYRVCYLHKTRNGFSVRESDNNGLNTKKIESALKELRAICSKLKSNEEKLVFDSFLSPILYLFKDSSYSYEQELRIMYQFKRSNRQIRHTNQSPPKLYVVNRIPLRIKELILGPRFKGITDTLPYLSEQLEIMNRKTHMPIPQITVSNIDFR